MDTGTRSYPGRGFAVPLVVLAIAGFLILPDAVAALANPSHSVELSPASTALALLLAVLVAGTGSRRVANSFLALTFLLQATQLAHYRYFGAFYSAYDVELSLHELRDTWVNAIDLLPLLAPPLAVSAAFCLLAVVACNALMPASPVFTRRVRITSLVLLSMFLLVPLVQSLAGQPSQKFQPNVRQLAVKNGLYGVSHFLGRRIRIAAGIGKPLPTYMPYRVEQVDDGVHNVVILMGESTSYRHLGMFGYQRDTTPDLDRYVGNPGFVQVRAISSAVSTRVSLALFYNLIYEPDNADAMRGMKHSLFRLAKRRGYATYYITTQENAGGLSYAFARSDIDVWRENADLPGAAYDDRLLQELKRLPVDYRRRNFITLHMRSAHGPYKDNYPPGTGKWPDQGVNTDDYLRNSYDNSILYTQKVIADIYAYFDSIGEQVHVFYVPDHGEAMGEEGRYGHNTLYLDNAYVPFLFYGVNVPNADVTAMRERLGCLTNHYLIGKEVARLLGYRVTNPNEKADTYYMNGIDTFGEAGYLTYSMAAQRNALCEKP